MQKPNEHGIYKADAIYELASHGRAFVRVKVAHCEDGLYRAAVDYQYSYGGGCSPIFASAFGWESATEARDDAAALLLERFPKGTHDPDSAAAELRELKRQLEQALDQPTLF